MKTDYEYLADSLSSLSGLPVRLYYHDSFFNLYHHTEFTPDLAMLEEPHILENKNSVSYYMDENFLCYGLFRAVEDNAALLIGPVAQIRIDRTTVQRILRRIGENASRANDLLNYFSSMPSYPLRNFLQILCTVDFFINGSKHDVSDLLLGEEPPLPAPAVSPKKEYEEATHNTMDLECELLSYVEHGRTDRIRAMFQHSSAGRAGTMAGNALRQEKDLVICTVTLVTRAAIRGGLDYESAFALSDLYIQKTELMNDLLGLTRLNAQMLIDFTQHVEALQCGQQDSKLLHSVRNYVLGHIGETITTKTISRALGMNRTYLCKLFMQETGRTVNCYITEIKLDEAKRLMDVTGKTVAEISEHLGFSTQSYFQNVFKKHTGETPLCYKKHRGAKTANAFESVCR